jgi:hypothetical protein
MPHSTSLAERLLFCLTAAAAVVLAGAALGATQPAATDIAADSSVELTERADSGSYQRYTIVIRSRDGAATLVADKDGTRIESEIPAGEYLALWAQLIDADLRTLTTPQGGRALPDSSRFVVRHHVGPDSGEFSVYGVDSLEDTRYRRIVRAILALGDRYLARAR